MLEFTLNKDDRDKSLHSLLQAHISYEQMSARRSFCVHALALGSVFIWVGACWPSFLPAPVQEFVHEFWGIVFCIAIVAGVEEWKWHRRLIHRVANHPGAKLHLARLYPFLVNRMCKKPGKSRVPGILRISAPRL